MDFTSRMAALLGAFRRERNGAVADSMRFYGAPFGLNYGVSLPTLRTLARAEAADHDFAKYLWRQDVRCLRLAALHFVDQAGELSGCVVARDVQRFGLNLFGGCGAECLERLFTPSCCAYAPSFADAQFRHFEPYA
jgi:hypothetical protein